MREMVRVDVHPIYPKDSLPIFSRVAELHQGDLVPAAIVAILLKEFSKKGK